MSLKDAHLQDARVVGEGSFKLDRRRAMEKLAKFQLEDPHRYVLELVAAAVCAGSTEITVRNDADDLELAWDGDHPTEDELDELFDHIFYRGTERRRRMLQHLAQGLYGALGLSPRWIRVERPGLSLDFTDPMAVQRTPNRREAGVFVHVRERFSWKVFVEAISPFDDAYETKLLRERAFLAPIPVVVGGVDITLPRLAPPTDQPVHTLPDGEVRGQVWLARADEAIDPRLGRSEGLVVTRDGVVVQRVRVDTAAPLRLVGWVDAPLLQLNASRSAVVEDEGWAALLAALDGAAATLVAAHLQIDAADPEARLAALELLARDSRFAKYFAEVPLLEDGLGRAWSPEALVAAEAIWTVREAPLLLPDTEAPLWLLPEDEAEGAQVRWRALRRLAGHKMRDATELLQARAQGRARREALARREHPLRFGAEAVLERSFTRGELRGVVAIPAVPQGGGFLVVLRVDGLPVEEARLTKAQGGDLPLLARVESPLLQADVAFQRVQDGAARRQALQAVSEEGQALLLAAARTLAQHPVVRPLLLAHLEALARGSSVDLDAWIREVPEPLAEAPLFVAADGRTRHSLRALPGKTVPFVRDTRLRELALVMDSLSPEALAGLGLDQILALDAGGRTILRQALGRALVDEGRALSDAVHAAARRSQPPVQPALPAGVVRRLAVHEEAAGLVGLVGLTDSPTPARAQVIHQGVPLGELPLDLDLPGAVACVSWDGAQPNAAWGGLTNASTAAAQLSTLLWPALVRLVKAVFAQEGVPLPLPPWAGVALRGPVDPALLEVPFLQTMGGNLRTLAEVRAASAVGYLLSESPPRLRAAVLDDVLLLDASTLEVVKASVSARKLRDASRRVQDLVRAHERFAQQEVVPRGLPAGRWAKRRTFRRDGLHGEVGVRLDTNDTPMLRVRCLYDDRVLVDPVLPHFLRVWAVVWGPDIQPDDKLAGLRDKALQQAVLSHVEAEARALVQALVQEGGADTDVQLAVLDQLLRRQAVPGLDTPAQRQAALARLRAARLLATLDGRLVSLDDASEAHTREVLRVVSVDERREPPPGGGLWLRVGELERRVLRAALGRSIPEGRAELDTWWAASQRRSRLPAEPPVPAGRFLATHAIREGEGTLWLGLSEAGQPELRLEWRLEGVIIDTETSSSPVALRVRVTDPALQPDSQFRKPAPGAALSAARSRVSAEIRRFMLALALEARLQGPAPGPGERPAVGDVVEVRWQVIVWAAREELAEPAWGELHLVETADGRTLTLPELQAVARRGPLRVVPPGVRGRTIDDTRPAIVASERLWRHLEGYARIEPFADTLPEEERVVARRSASPVVCTPTTGPDVLLTRALSGGREGFVQVVRSGENSVGLHVGWRALDRTSPSGIIPLVGEVSDPRLTPDPAHRRALSDDALKALHRDLSALSAALLPDLLAAARLPADRGLLLRVCSRAFSNARALKKADGDLRRLAELPLLETGEGTPISPWALAQERQPPRWAPRGQVLRSLDPARPFICIDRDELPWLTPFLGGQWEADTAAQEQEIRVRRSAATLPHALPGEPADYLAQNSAESGGARLLVGISRRLPAIGEVWIRSGGVPIAQETRELAGLVAVIDVPAEQVDAAWRTAKLTPAQRQALENAHQRTLAQCAEALRRPEQRAALLAVLRDSGSRDRSLRSLPLLACRPQGSISLGALSSASCILCGDVDVPPELVAGESGVVVLEDLLGLEAILLAAGIPKDRIQRASQWVPRARARLASEAAERAAQARALAATSLRRAVDQHLAVLTTNLPERRALRSAALGVQADLERFPLYDAALADPDGPVGRLMAAWLLERVLPTTQRADLGPELWARLAEHL